jgi:hypothetical protein
MHGKQYRSFIASVSPALPNSAKLSDLRITPTLILGSPPLSDLRITPLLSSSHHGVRRRIPGRAALLHGAEAVRGRLTSIELQSMWLVVCQTVSRWVHRSLDWTFSRLVRQLVGQSVGLSVNLSAVMQSVERFDQLVGRWKKFSFHSNLYPFKKAYSTQAGSLLAVVHSVNKHARQSHATRWVQLVVALVITSPRICYPGFLV